MWRKLAICFSERSAIKKDRRRRSLSRSVGLEGQFPNMTSCLSARRVSIDEQELTISRTTGRRACLFGTTALPKRFFGSGKIRRLPVDIGMPRFRRDKDDALAVRRPDRKAF